MLASAAKTAAAQDTVPIVTLPAASAKSADTFGAIVDIRELPGGALLVDDGGRRQIKLLSSSLGDGTLVRDSAGLTRYGPRVMPLLPYLGDSTLFPDLVQRPSTVEIFDPHGAAARTLAMPTANDVAGLRNGAADNIGRLIFLGVPAITRMPGHGLPPAAADSTPVLRADLNLRRTDTIAYVALPLRRADVLQTNGAIISYWTADPLGTIDEWAVLTDGSLAMVRGHDYHIDWIRPDGRHESTAKLPFDWRQLTEGDKEKMVDSAVVLRRVAAGNNTLVNDVIRILPWRNTAPDGPVVPKPDTVGALYSRNNGGGLLTVLPAERPSADRVFDYYAPLRKGAAMADMDDHLWILPTTSKQSKAGELVYDVVNTKGELFERVRVPLGRYIVGFGHDGVVYMATGNLTSGFTIERTKLPK
jgi:hypothetical protein